MIKYPSTEQFRNVIHNVKHRSTFVGLDDAGQAIFNPSLKLPVLKYIGTVKIHGTNASVSLDTKTRELSYQSRERVLTLAQDNATFMLTQMAQAGAWTAWLGQIDSDSWWASDHDAPTNITVYGEWCGKGIQKGVAVAECPKMFVIFALKVTVSETQSYWVDIRGMDVQGFDSVYSIYDFPTFEIEIDFSRPELAQNKMIEMTLEVENECPVGKHFGISGVGEGIVFKPDSPEWNSSAYWLKSKGEKHSVSKVKTLNHVDAEAMASIYEFVDSAVTEGRLEWALNNLIVEQLKTPDMKSMGDFIRTVFNDIMKEEIDVIVASGLDPKKLGSPIANKSRTWYVNKINSGI